MSRVYWVTIRSTTWRILALTAALWVVVTAPAFAIDSGYGRLSAQQQAQLGIYFAKGDYSCGAAAASGSSASGGSSLPPTVPALYKTLFEQAASKFGTSPQYLASLFMSEHYDTWLPFDTNWDTPDKISPDGARGPFQFLPGTWDAHKQDGNADGKMDVFNIYDAAFAAADMAASANVTPTTPLGDVAFPFKPGTILYAAAAYNWGIGNVQRLTTENTSRTSSVVAEATQAYIKNVYTVITSGFINGAGAPHYPDKVLGLNSTASTVPASSATPTNGAGTACTCAPTAPLIVVDPGHSGTSVTVTDPATRLQDSDYPNHPEMEDVFDVAGIVKTQLTAAGYRVLLTKESATDTKTLRQRADVASLNHAALAISIHDQAGALNKGGIAFSSGNNHVYIQHVGDYRVNVDGQKVSFTNADVAKLSAEYGQDFIAARTTAEGHTVTLDVPHLAGRDLAQGNIWMVQLLSSVPWIYNEVGGTSTSGTITNKGGLSNEDKNKYAAGLVAGVEKAVPINPGATTTSTASDVGGCNGGTGNKIADQAVALAWQYPFGVNPSYDRQNGRVSPLTPPPPYLKALTQFNRGSILGNQGADCGVFVATVMRSSGADPNYPGIQTDNQLRYVTDQSKKGKYILRVGISDTRDLHPGDIILLKPLLNPDGSLKVTGHTFLYIGKRNDTKYNIASASLDEREPNLGTYVPVDELGRGPYYVATLVQ